MEPVIGANRLVHQQVAAPTAADPGEVVRQLGAVQAQDYLSALWAVGLRTLGASEQSIEQALAEGRIVRTWPMRGTIHFVASDDVRWMLDLLAPRVVQRSQGRLRQLSLDAATLAASETIVGRALEGGKQLTRPALYAALEAGGITDAQGARGLHILQQLAHERLICFGARDGKQPTFTLLDEWVPSMSTIPKDAALATLALRYFTSHGPASVQDFAWWSGLTLGEAKASVGAVAGQLATATFDQQSYYFAEAAALTNDTENRAFLLPPFDEFLIAYRDRRASLDPLYNDLVVPGSNGIFNPIIVFNGCVIGTWKRVLKPKRAVLSFSVFPPHTDFPTEQLAPAIEQYGRFLGLAIEK